MLLIWVFKKTSAFHTLFQTIGTSILGFFLFLIFQSNSHAEIKPQDDVEVSEQGWTISIENDSFSPENSTDRWFTNGIQATTAFRREQEPPFLKWTKDIIRPLLIHDNCEGLGCDITLIASFGQNMYTPRIIEIASPQLRDRPWAGWLYGGLGFSVYNGNRHEIVSVKAGPIGPASLAEEAQKFIHCCVVSSPEPKGWNNQLRPMIGAQVSYLTTFRYTLTDNLDFQPSLGFVVGNTRVLARLGAGLNWSFDRGEGRRLQPGSLDEGEFFVPDFNSEITNSSVLDSLKHTVIYGHIQSSQVFYNVFIEGDAYDGKHNIELINNVITSTIGLTIPFGSKGQHKVGFALKNRSPEFKVRGEIAEDAYQTWGVISYSRDLDF